MSFDVGVHLWFDQGIEDWPLIFLECIDVALEPVSETLVLPTDSHITVQSCRRSENNIIWRETLYSRDRKRLKKIPFQKGDCLLMANLAFPCRLYFAKDRTIRQTIRPLTIRLAGPDFDPNGYEYKRNGLIRISYSNVNVFGVPIELVDQAKNAVASGLQDQYLQMISEVDRNFDVVRILSSRLIERLDPTHLIICTEWEVHPLTAHGLYHRNIADFGDDIHWITRLQREGGLYLFAGDSSKFMAARGISRDYGYLRSQQSTSEDLISKLELQMDRVGRVQNRVALSGDEIRLALNSSVSVEKIESRHSLAVWARESPYAYLAEPFFHLFDLIASKRDASVN